MCAAGGRWGQGQCTVCVGTRPGNYMFRNVWCTIALQDLSTFGRFVQIWRFSSLTMPVWLVAGPRWVVWRGGECEQRQLLEMALAAAGLWLASSDQWPSATWPGHPAAVAATSHNNRSHHTGNTTNTNNTTNSEYGYTSTMETFMFLLCQPVIH